MWFSKQDWRSFQDRTVPTIANPLILLDFVAEQVCREYCLAISGAVVEPMPAPCMARRPVLRLRAREPLRDGPQPDLRTVQPRGESKPGGLGRGKGERGGRLCGKGLAEKLLQLLRPRCLVCSAGARRLPLLAAADGGKIPSVGLRFALVADLHSCRYGAGQRMLSEKILSLNPDAILLSGDIFDDRLPDDNANATRRPWSSPAAWRANLRLSRVSSTIRR